MWLALLVACGATPEVAPRPSVVWISLDTVRADRLGVYGGPAATPALTALGGAGLVYERAFTHFPETGLSHWALLTGVLPEVHGNLPAAGDSMYTGPTAAEVAKKHGYATAAFIGGITMQSGATGLQRGFDVYDDQFAFHPSDMKRDGNTVVDAARAWITERPGPYFAFVHLFDAHFPYTPDDPRRYDPDYAGTVDGSEGVLRPWRDTGAALPERDLAHVQALYDAELTELDAAIAPLLAALPADVVVVVTADHGESFDHGYLFNHRGSLFDGVMHIPFLLRAPGLAPARVPTLVGGIDVLPTLAEVAGWTLDAPVQGRAVLPGDAGSGEVWARTDPWMLTPLAEGLQAPLLAVRTERWKVIWTGDNVGRAYDLDADPGEAHPVMPPAELVSAPERYTAAIASMKPHTRSVAPRRALDPGEREKLEALGYVDPHGGPAPGGAPPYLPPPKRPEGPPTPPSH